MKMKQIIKILLSTALVFTLSAGCDTEDLHNLNINPQAVNEIDLHYMFSAAQLSIASNGVSGDNRYTDWRTNIGLCCTAIQQLATNGGDISSAGMFYRHNEETVTAIFEFTYNDQLKNIEEVLKQTAEGGYADGEILNTRHAARILRAWSFARLTDFYGAIPYTEANKGLEGNFFPTYDNQSVIYPDLLKELDEAVAGLNDSNFDPDFAKSDMIYQGDIAQWKRWGNSLMLRLAMMVSNVDPAMAATYVTKAVAGGVFQSNDDNVWVPQSDGPSVWTNQNGISRAFYPGDGGNRATLNETFVNFLKGADPNDVSDDDPRLMIYTDGIGNWSSSAWTPLKQNPLDQRGYPPGRYQSTVAAMNGWPDNFLMDTTFSRINPYMLDYDDPYMIMNYAEVEFLLAEALERNIGSGISGTAQVHFENGVKAAMQMLEPYFTNDETFDGSVSDAEVAAYLAKYPYGVYKPALEMIGEQLWASFYFNWYEAWTYWRRTGFPVLVAFTDDPANVTGGIIPVRMPYPNTEIAANPNFSQGSKHNYTSPVWWDGGSE
jgi:hypothetical protein